MPQTAAQVAAAPRVLICDDSELARRQLARALPPGWAAMVSYARDGVSALDEIRAGGVDLLFLDLNMPGMDGYGVLELLRREALEVMVVVVSGDIQPQARARVEALGALAFLKKPVDPTLLRQQLRAYGFEVVEGAGGSDESVAGPVDLLDGCREVANVAIGQAADRLARRLDVFVDMPLPSVSVLEPPDLLMALGGDDEAGERQVVCQGFSGEGVRGEMLTLFGPADLEAVAALFCGGDAVPAATEVLMETAGLITGACLNGFTEQLDIQLSLAQPVWLGTAREVADMVRAGSGRWQRALAVELGFCIRVRDIRWDLLLLLDESAWPAIRERLHLLLA